MTVEKPSQMHDNLRTLTEKLDHHLGEISVPLHRLRDLIVEISQYPELEDIAKDVALMKERIDKELDTMLRAIERVRELERREGMGNDS